MIRKLGVVLYCLLQLWLSSAHAQTPVTNFSATPTSGCGPLTVTFTDQSTNTPTFWSWDFGNGQTSSLQNPAVTYPTAGNYTVTLIARNASGADVMRKTNYITVFPFPQASFTANSGLACAPANIQFTDNSTPGQGAIVSWNWSLGDGSTSTQQNPSHTYTQPGYYSVALTVQNSSGCSNSVSYARLLRIVSGIQPNFVFNQSSTTCSAPFVGTLLNQTAGPGTLSYNWTIGNGATPAGSTAPSPAITFPTDGTYNINLQVASSLGCTASIQQPLTFSNSTALIKAPATTCVNSPTIFSDGSTPAPSSIAWTFGDGTNANNLTPSKTYTTTGTYTVKMVNYYTSCADSTTQNITVINVPTPAFAATPTTSCKAPFTVAFADQTTPAAASWSWNFGDGQTSTQQNPTHTYTTTGTFNVTLTVTGAGSCPGSTTKNAFISIQPPAVSIGGSLSACVNATGDNSIISPAANVNAPDGVAHYAWSAPGSNEGSSTAAAPSFTYNTAGNHTISLTITTTGGCTASATATAQISTSTPAAFTFTPNPVCGNSLVTFKTTSVPATGYIWGFGNAIFDTINAPANSATYSYKKLGTYPATLTTNNNGCRTTSTPQSIVVNAAIPNFGYSVICGGPPFIAMFTDTSLTNGDPVTYSWNYGDGNTAVGPLSTLPYLPPHAYASPGTYAVILQITDGACVTSITKNVVIGSVTPSFTPGPAPYCHSAPLTFTSTSTTGSLPSSFISSYAWTIDANLPVTTTTPSYSTDLYPNGPYLITLTVKDINGCTYTSPTTTIQVVGPTALYANPASGGGCENKVTTFNDQSTPDPTTGSPITNWHWDFGDGTQTTETAPFTHIYIDTGAYSVILRVTDAEGCGDSYTLPINVTSPIANFSGPDSFYCPGVALTFIDSSKGYNLTDAWNFNNGTPSPSASPTTTFATSGIYNVTLTVTDKYACTNSITNPVNIKQPVAAFDIYDTVAICTPLQTIFAAHTQYSDSLYWDFGDGSTSTLDSTSHFYNTTNTFIATLYAQGPGGCLTSAKRNVYVENPYILTNFTYSPLQHCDSLTAQFAITPPPFANFLVAFGDLAEDSSGNTAPIHTYRTTGTYGPSLQLTDQSGCIVDINQPEGYITVLGATPYFSVNKQAFCDSATANFIDYTISNDGLASETYNFGDGTPTQNQTPGTGAFNPSHYYDQVGTWLPKLTVTTTDNCTESYTDTIRVYQTPHPLISTSSLLCTGLIQFNGSLTAPQVDTITWAWNFDNNQQSSLQNPAITMTPGTYTVTLQTSTSFGCKADTSAGITIFGPPTIKGPAEVTTPVGIPVTLPITYGANIVSYAWTPTSNLDCPTCPNPTATLIFSTEYYVTVTDNNSCTATDSILVKTICNSQNYFLPNTFSPNGDGVNDYFYPRGTSLYNVQSLTVFNRWGEMVFQRLNFPANTANMGWNGTFGGKPLPADVYVYIVEVVCDNAQVVAIHGSVTLLR